jgi:hypothetical protein
MLKGILFLAGLMLASTAATAAVYPTSPIRKTAESGFAVSNNAYLKALKSTEFTSVWRLGFSAPDDSPRVLYTSTNAACSLNSGNGDDGSQVKLADGNCAIAHFSGSVSLLVFGPDPTGVADSGPAWQAAYNATAGKTDCVFVPAGTYRINTQVSMTGNPPCFRGVKPNTAQSGGTKTGTWIHITSTSLQPFSLSGNSVAGRGGFFDMGFYNDQPAPSTGFVPTAYQYPFVINGGVQDLVFRGLMFYNTTHCISITTTGRVTVEDVSGQPLGTCLNYDNDLDIVYLDHIHLWPFWSSDANVWQYTQQNVDPIVFQRADSPMIGRIFTFAYHSGIKFAASSNGVTTGFQIDDLQADAATYGIWITGNNTQGQIANYRGAAGSYSGTGFAAGSESYRDESSNSDVMIANFQSFSSNESAVHMLAVSNLRIGNMEVYNCNGNNDGSSAVKMAAAGVIAIGNLPVVVGTQCASQPFINAAAGAWFSAPSVRQTWTPTIIGSGGGSGSTYNAQYGQFWFDGTKVHVEFNVSATAFTGMTGNVSIAGLPFTATGLANMRGSCTISQFAGVTLDTNYTILSAVVPASANTIQFIENASGLGGQLVPVTRLSTGANFVGSCEYQVN